jgi:hypothetical protein
MVFLSLIYGHWWTIQWPAIIRAKERCVIFHAFGCSITVMVTALSSKTTAPVKIGGADFGSLIPMDDLPPDEPDVNPSWISGLDEEVDAVKDPSHEEKGRWPAIDSKKASNSNRPFLFTLVHGDVLVFYGDDFEVFMNAKVYWLNNSLFLAVFFETSSNGPREWLYY